MKTLGLTALLLLAPALALADGADLFAKRCASCHGKDGKGKTKMGEKLKIRDLTDAKVQAEITDAGAEKGLTEGVKDKETGKERMPAFAGKLTGAEIQELVRYVRTLKGK